jgi:hypothetical protein
MKRSARGDLTQGVGHGRDIVFDRRKGKKKARCFSEFLHNQLIAGPDGRLGGSGPCDAFRGNLHHGSLSREGSTQAGAGDYQAEGLDSRTSGSRSGTIRSLGFILIVEDVNHSMEPDELEEVPDLRSGRTELEFSIHGVEAAGAGEEDSQASAVYKVHS